MSELDILLDKESWLLEIDTDRESGIKEYTWNWDNDEHPPLEEGRKELADLRTRIAELEDRLEKSALVNGRLLEDIDNLETTTTWQPIKTAPKDGTEIRLLGRIKKEYIGHWDKEFSVWSVRPHSEGFFVIMPTHWMPLPKPPEEK